MPLRIGQRECSKANGATITLPLLSRRIDKMKQVSGDDVTMRAVHPHEGPRAGSKLAAHDFRTTRNSNIFLG